MDVWNVVPEFRWWICLRVKQFEFLSGGGCWMSVFSSWVSL